jgi:hypothetical protein
VFTLLQNRKRLYLASDGMLQAAYFTSARFRQESSDSTLNSPLRR